MVLILSPILKGLADNKMIPAIALLIVFRDEKPITVPTTTLIAPAAATLIEENWNRIIIKDITMIIIFMIERIPLSSPLSKFREPIDLLRK